MDLKQLFSLLDEIAYLNKEHLTSDSVAKALTKVEDSSFFHDKKITAFELLNADLEKPKNLRICCGCYGIDILDGIYEAINQVPKNEEFQCDTKIAHKGAAKSNPKPPSQLLSIKQEKAVEDVCVFVFYNCIIGCLDDDSSLFMKVKLAKEKLVFGSHFCIIKTEVRHSFLAHIFKVLLKIFKHEYLGVNLRNKLLDEYFNVLLYLCFAPSNLKHHKDDVTFFRSQLDELLTRLDKFSLLRFFLLLKGTLAQTPRNSWLKKACDSLLVRRFLYQDGGVALIVRVALDICGDSDWRKKEAAATIIAGARSSEEELFRNICPQIIALFKMDDLKPDVFHVLSFILFQLTERNGSLAQKFLHAPLIQPLVNLTLVSVTHGSWTKDVLSCVAFLYKLYVEILPPSITLKPFIQPIICPLIKIATLPPTCHVKSSALRIIIRYLAQLHDDECIKSLFVLSQLEKNELSPFLNNEISLSVGVNEIIVNIKKEERSSYILDEDEKLAKCIVTVLEKLKNTKVTLQFYQTLVSYIDFSSVNEDQLPQNFLLIDSEKALIKFNKMRRLLMSVSLLSFMTGYDHEQLIKDIFSDLIEAISFVKSLFLIGKQKCDDPGLSQTKADLLVNCLMVILHSLCSRSTEDAISSYEWKALRELLPTLEILKTASQHEQAILDYVEMLHNVILTHGVVDSTTDRADSDTHFKKKDKETLIKSSFEAALKDVFSPDIPIRGHGILALTRLIEEKDEEALKNRERIFSLFRVHLKEEDSYVYLLAIEGLVVLCDAFPEQVVPLLTEEASNVNRKIEDRAKLIESLTRVARRLGPLMPKYRNYFINPLLKGANESDESIVVSSLSCLGEVCKECKFALGDLLYEVFSSLDARMEVINSLEVRRASVMVISLILQGLQGNIFQLLKEILPKLHKKLKLVYQTSEDPVLQLHSDIALKELDIVTRSFFTPKNDLRKNIFIKDIPPL